jgi:phosphoribosylamine--glycine ligase
MKVLIVGGGGREHALAWKCAQSPRVHEVLVAPGNAGTDTEPRVRNVDIAASDTARLVELAQRERVALTIIGPEAPLVDGIVDAFQRSGLRCFGPNQLAARLEGSKAFTKEFLSRHAIPTAAYRTFTPRTYDAAWLRAQQVPLVIKASGLASGKGVIIAQSLDEAEATVHDMFRGRFGEAGAEIVIEEFMQGEEASFIVMADGQHALPLATSQDHKRVFDGDRGPNTGGMGAYSPAPVVTPAIHARVMREIISPTLRGLKQDGSPFIGFLYAGLMIGVDGAARVIEFNCRLGDPETQPILARLRTDLTTLCDAALDGRLDTIEAEWDPQPALGVVLAAAGYPDKVRSGDAIDGLEAAARRPGKVFHAGTRRDGATCLTSGGRVLCAVGLGTHVSDAQRQAYALVDCIRYDGMHYRRDIGARAVAREQDS